jgi:hypothetical protein
VKYALRQENSCDNHRWQSILELVRRGVTVLRALTPSRPIASHQGISSLAHLLLLVIAVALSHSLARAQSLSAEQAAPSPSSTVAQRGSPASGLTSIQPLPLQQEPAAPCSLRVPDMTPQPSAESQRVNPPHGPSAFTPLTVHCKFKLFLTTTYSPYTFASAAFQATEAQATGQWPHYGGGMQGWGKRLGATLANTESRRFIQGFALSTLLHQDPRYFPSPKRRFFSRAWYSATRVVITKNDNGNSTFNTSEFLGALFTSALQNSYYPNHDRTLGDTMNRFGGALSSDATGYLLREFTPDMKHLFRKHAPKKILKIEEKLPIPAEDKP